MAQAAAETAARAPFLADLDKTHLHPLWDRYKRITPLAPGAKELKAVKSIFEDAEHERTLVTWSGSVTPPASPAVYLLRKRLSVFERYLSIWVGLCMVVGVGLGLAAPGLMEGLRDLEFGAGSHISIMAKIIQPCVASA